MTASKTQAALKRLIDIMAALRGPDGCPWDAEQTPESLKPYILEEAYEVLEAIDRGEPAAVCDELGDLLLQVVFQARIFEERGEFDLGDVATAIADKLVRRHPHVFGDRRQRDIEALNAQWERIKATEKTSRGEPSTLLAGVPRTLPALLRAAKVADKARRARLHGGDGQILHAKVHEELSRFEHALHAGEEQAMAEHLGDILFSVVNLGRLVRIDAEQALRATLDRFTERVTRIERRLAERGLGLDDVSPLELDALWEEVRGDAGVASKT